MLRRPLTAGVVLALLECGLVLASGRELFLSWVELARYAAFALAAVPLVCLLGFAAGRAVFVWIARGVAPADAAFALRLRTAVAASAIVPIAAALHALSSGRRVRDLPGRLVAVGLFAVVSALAL